MGDSTKWSPAHPTWLDRHPHRTRGGLETVLRNVHNPPTRRIIRGYANHLGIWRRRRFWPLYCRRIVRRGLPLAMEPKAKPTLWHLRKRIPLIGFNLSILFIGPAVVMPFCEPYFSRGTASIPSIVLCPMIVLLFDDALFYFGTVRYIETGGFTENPSLSPQSVCARTTRLYLRTPR